MNKCKACGFEIGEEYEDEDEFDGYELCKYCYYIRNIGSSKFVLFNAMVENGNKFVTVQEALTISNAYRDTINKSHTTYVAVYNILYRYSKYYDDASKRGSGFLLLKHKTLYSM